MNAVHTDQTFEQELIHLRELLLAMAGHCELMLNRAMKAFATMNRDEARRVIREDEDIDRMEMTIDSQCLSMLARRQPVARDLRFITTSMKTVTDLERVGDLVADICWVLVDLEGDLVKEQALVTRLMDLAEKTRDLLRDSLDAFVAEDPERALEIIPRDRAINDGHTAIQKQVLVGIAEDPDRLETAFRLLSISRRLERIGDHAKNVAEQIIFMVRGEDIRHQGSS